jgi:hypothetical protein
VAILMLARILMIIIPLLHLAGGYPHYQYSISMLILLVVFISGGRSSSRHSRRSS